MQRHDKMKSKMKEVKKLLFLLLILSFISNSLSKLGEKCLLSGDCIEGYCENNLCILPDMELIENKTYIVVGECNYTADCLYGFCYSNQCIYPKREEYLIFSPGIKSGCAGIIENCIGFWCVFCNVSWIILIVGSAVAGIVSRKRGRILPFLMFALPIFGGIVVFPIFGFVISLIEIFLISLVK